MSYRQLAVRPLETFFREREPRRIRNFGQLDSKQGFESVLFLLAAECFRTEVAWVVRVAVPIAIIETDTPIPSFPAADYLGVPDPPDGARHLD